MKNVLLSAFSDEAGSSLDTQMETLKKNRLSYMEIRGVEERNISDLSLDEVKEVKKRLDQNGIKVSAIGSPIGKISVLDDFEDHLELFGHVLDIAGILQSRYIRMFSFFIPEGEDPGKYREVVIERWKAFIEKAKGRNIILLHENEKDIYGDTADRCLDLLDTLKCDYLRLTFDPANFVQCDEEVYPRAYNKLKDHIEYMHIKDAIFESGEVVPAGYGDGRLEELVSELKVKGYKGFMSLEPHLTDFQGFSSLETDEKFILKKGDNIEKFDLAVMSLKKILDKHDYGY